MKRYLIAVLPIAFAACGGDSEETTGDAAFPVAAEGADTAAVVAAPAAGDSAVAVMRDTAGRELGRLTLAPAGDAVEVRGTLTGLAPGEHAIHVHTIGRCEPDFEAAGGHWNPEDRPHGRPGQGHLGDMPNLTVGADSAATVRVTTGPGASLRGNAAPYMLLDSDGAAVVVHAGADDFQTQPSGGSGGRVACGVAQG